MYKFGSSHKIKLDARRNSKEVEARQKETCAISNKEKNTKVGTTTKNKGTEHIHFLLLGDGAITNNFTECEGG